MRDFCGEYKAFLTEHPYETIEVKGIRIRYIYGGMTDRLTILFFHGLEMQEMWIRYAEYFQRDYSFLIYEYPLHTIRLDEQMELANSLLEQLKIERVILIGGSDGGMHAQYFAEKYPGKVVAMNLLTTLTLDSDYVRHMKKELWYKPLFMFLMRHIKTEKLFSIMLKKVSGYMDCEAEEDRKYGISFFGVMRTDLQYKDRLLHSFELLYDFLNYDIFRREDFEYLRGKILILLPEKDIFSKKDQQTMVDFYRQLDAEVIDMPGGHLGCVVQADAYMEKINEFLRGV